MEPFGKDRTRTRPNKVGVETLSPCYCVRHRHEMSCILISLHFRTASWQNGNRWLRPRCWGGRLPVPRLSHSCRARRCQRLSYHALAVGLCCTAILSLIVGTFVFGGGCNALTARSRYGLRFGFLVTTSWVAFSANVDSFTRFWMTIECSSAVEAPRFPALERSSSLLGHSIS